MQSDGNSWKINTFRGAITSELMISSQIILKTHTPTLFLIRVKQKLLFVQNLYKRVVHKLCAHEKCPFFKSSYLIASHFNIKNIIIALYDNFDITEILTFSVK